MIWNINGWWSKSDFPLLTSHNIDDSFDPIWIIDFLETAYNDSGSNENNSLLLENKDYNQTISDHNNH